MNVNFSYFSKPDPMNLERILQNLRIEKENIQIQKMINQNNINKKILSPPPGFSLFTDLNIQAVPFSPGSSPPYSPVYSPVIFLPSPEELPSFFNFDEDSLVEVVIEEPPESPRPVLEQSPPASPRKRQRKVILVYRNKDRC